MKIELTEKEQKIAKVVKKVLVFGGILTAVVLVGNQAKKNFQRNTPEVIDTVPDSVDSFEGEVTV